MYQLFLQAKLVGAPLLTVAVDLCDAVENEEFHDSFSILTYEIHFMTKGSWMLIDSMILFVA